MEIVPHILGRRRVIRAISGGSHPSCSVSGGITIITSIHEQRFSGRMTRLDGVSACWSGAVPYHM
jgi:hypothetical protein